MLLRTLTRLLDHLPQPARAPHLVTGRRGEDAAYFHLRDMGYVMVARNFRSPRRRGELDLIGWDKETLCFIEVKTRSTRAVAPPEAAVDEDKRRELCAVAREYLRRWRSAHRRSHPEEPTCRFDVVSLYFEPGMPPQVTLFKGAFPLS